MVHLNMPTTWYLRKSNSYPVLLCLFSVFIAKYEKFNWTERLVFALCQYRLIDMQLCDVRLVYIKAWPGAIETKPAILIAQMPSELV